MDSTQGLIDEPTASASEVSICPACGTPAGRLPPVPVALFAGASLGRCARCGDRRRRSGSELPVAAEPELAAASGLPHLSGDRVVDPAGTPGYRAPIPPESTLILAAEHAVRHALSRAWRFLRNPAASDYLERIGEATAGRIEGRTGRVRIHLFEDPAVRCLALPSGTLLLSFAALRSAEDEAELTFLIGHELAHVASGDAARRVVALTLHSASRAAGDPAADAWLDAAVDLMRLGHGAEREHAADLTALRAVLTLGYDPHAVKRHLERLTERADAGDPTLAEHALAHPLPGDRLRRIQKTWGAQVQHPGESRVNREVFRRVLGLSGVPAEMEAYRPFARDGERCEASPWHDWKPVWIGVGILLLASIFLVLGLLLAR